jgi:hypothetical protein
MSGSGPEERAMSKITISAELTALFKGIRTPSELIGPDGQPVGFFTPPEGDDDVTLEELKAADAAGGEYTMDDVFKLLEKYK